MDINDVYSYDAETGNITFKCDRHARKVSGKVAGWIRTDHSRRTSYIELRADGKTVKAHRLAWRLHYGA